MICLVLIHQRQTEDTLSARNSIALHALAAFRPGLMMTTCLAHLFLLTIPVRVAFPVVGWRHCTVQHSLGSFEVWSSTQTAASTPLESPAVPPKMTVLDAMKKRLLAVCCTHETIEVTEAGAFLRIHAQRSKYRIIKEY